MLKQITSLTIAAVMLTLMFSPAGSVPLSERVVQQMKDEGTFDDYIEHIRKLRSEGRDQPQGKILDNRSFALGGDEVVTHRILVILIDFHNKPYTQGYASPDATDFDSVLFSDGLNPTGSMKEFYYENSYGNYIIEGDVVGWYRAGFDHDEYVSYPLSPAYLVREAVQAADADVDFANYDNDGNGYVEGVIVVHAGTGREESDDSTEIHSHMSSLMPAEAVDGVFVNLYTIQPEESAQNEEMSSIGVFCHEWGHILGLPDLYDTDYSSSGVGSWSLMASGNYNGSSKLPAHFDAWCKKYLGWVNPINVTETMIAAEIPAVEYSNVVYRLNRNGVISSEYWLIENRCNTGFDAALPGCGLMIYHIDEDKPGNSSEWHPLVFVEQADGKFDLQNPGNRGDDGDTWPNGDLARDFHDKTTPDSKYYVSLSSQVGVWNISDPDSVMTADLEVSFTRPWVELGNAVFRDNAYGNGNGIPEAGEKIQLILSLTNDWAEATGISVTMTTDDPALTITEGVRSFPNVGTGETVSNVDLPFEFEIPGTYESRIDSFYFEITANGGSYTVSRASEYNIGRPQLLIVDDDNGDNYEEYMAWPLYQKRTPATVWKKYLSGSPTREELKKYHIVIWLTGDPRDFMISEDDIMALKGYLNAGGNLFMTGQGLAEQLTVQDPYFLHDYLKAEYVNEDYSLIPLLSSGEGPVFGDMDSIVITGASGANNQTVYDHILPVNGGVAEWEYLNGQGQPRNYGAVSYNGNYKSIFFSFGFEAIESDEVRFETQSTVLARIIEFFGDIPTDVENPDEMAVNLPSLLNLGQNYPNPFNPVTTISYVITGAGPRYDRTRLEIFNVAGQKVRTLVDRDEIPGEYTVLWDGRDQAGREVSSGIYFYRLVRGEQEQSKKMLLLK